MCAYKGVALHKRLTDLVLGKPDLPELTHTYDNAEVMYSRRNSRRHSSQEYHRNEHNQHAKSRSRSRPRSPRHRPRQTRQYQRANARTTRQKSNFTQVRPTYPSFNLRKLDVLTKMYDATRESQDILANILDKLGTTALPTTQAKPPMPPMEEYQESIASTGSIDSNQQTCPYSPMSALQQYASDDFGLTVLKTEFEDKYPDVD